MAADQSEIEATLIAFLQESIVAEGVRIQPETILRDIGIDSYSVIEMVLFIERRFGVVLPEEKLIPGNLKSVRALALCTAEMQE